LNFDLSDLVILYKDVKLIFYIATSLDVKDKTIIYWQQELDKMKADGTYQKIISKYRIE